MNGTFAVFLSCLISLTTLTQGKEKTFNISIGELHKTTVLYFTSGWKYSSTYSGNWTSTGLNDSSWKEVNTIRNDGFPSDWKGTGWFRFHFTIDSSLFNKPVYLHIWSAGKQEVYIDGKFAAVNSDWKRPKVVTFNPWQDHILAVKYINDDPMYYKDAGFSEGFRIGFGNIEEVMQSDLQELRGYSNEQMFFTAITLAFGLLHLILFLFNRQFKRKSYILNFLICICSKHIHGLSSKSCGKYNRTNLFFEDS